MLVSINDRTFYSIANLERLETAFTRNTYSADEQKPWLIHLDAPENELLSRHISDVWRRKTINRNGDPDLVDQIAEKLSKSCLSI